MSSRELFAEVTKRAYIENLRKELNACLDHIIDAADALQEDIWHVEAEIALRDNTQRFQELHKELGQVLDGDPVAWLRAMTEASE